MKRRIEVIQLDELNEGQKQRLRQWWKPEVGDFFIDKIYPLNFSSERIFIYGPDTVHFVDKNSLPVLSIEQMLELLNETKIEIRRYGLNNPFVFNGKENAELCNALWQGVKEIL